LKTTQQLMRSGQKKEIKTFRGLSPPFIKGLGQAVATEDTPVVLHKERYGSTSYKERPERNIYTRPKTIEAAIDEAMKQNLDTLIEHARIAKSSVPGFLPLECLVHLIRAARRSGIRQL